MIGNGRRDRASDFLGNLSTGDATNPVESPAAIRVGGYSRLEYEKQAEKWRNRKRVLSLKSFAIIVLASAWVAGTASCIYEWLHGAILTELLARSGAALVGAGVGSATGFAGGILLLLYLKLKLRRVRISDEYFPIVAFSVGVFGTIVGSVTGVAIFHTMQKDWYMSLRALRNVTAEQRPTAYELRAAGVQFELDDDRIVGAKCIGIVVTEAMLEKLGLMVDVDHIDFMNAPIAGNALSQLRGLTELTTIGFERTPVDERTLRGLAALPQLRDLTFKDVALSQKTFARFGELTQIETLTIASWSIVPLKCAEFVPQIERMSSLKKLYLFDLTFDEPELLQEFRRKHPDVVVKTEQRVIQFTSDIYAP